RAGGTGRGHFTNYTTGDGLSGNIIQKFYEGRDGTIWIAHTKGINLFRGGRFSSFSLGDKELKIRRIIEDANRHLWFITYSPVELYRVAGDTLTRFTRGDGLPGGTVSSIFSSSNGDVWIVCADGLSRYRKGTFTNYFTKEGFPVNKFIMEDKEKNLWMGTKRGLFCFDGKSFKSYNAVRLGVATNNWSTGLKDSTGKLWFGGQEGIATFRPPPVKPNTSPPPIYISRVKVM
ncbi:MAG: hypothetical protein GY765_14460, partial [bacterium]|nr:hypothetical protein [bacterium]